MHKMRRFKQELSAEETLAILERGTSGVLALSGDDDYPYAVPISGTLRPCHGHRLHDRQRSD